MAVIVSIHSFRGGTGKSNTTANVASLLAQSGRRVGVIDADTVRRDAHTGDVQRRDVRGRRARRAVRRPGGPRRDGDLAGGEDALQRIEDRHAAAQSELDALRSRLAGS